MPGEVPEHQPLADDDNNPFAADFTAEELWRRLRRCSNTAPGPDGIRYPVWKKADAGD